MEEIREQMSAIEDPRHQSYIKYPLADILIIIMCAVLSFSSVFFFSVLLGAEKSQSRPRVSSGADCGISAVKSAALSSGLDR